MTPDPGPLRVNVVRRPSLYIFGRQEVDWNEVNRFLADHGMSGWTTDAPSAGETLAETGGRLCYMSFRNQRPGGNAAYLDRIKQQGHGSVTEHAVWTLVITGISRRCGEQLTRLRVGFSPSQLSQRFVDEGAGGVLDVVAPPEMEWDFAALDRYEAAAAAGDNPEPTRGAETAACWVASMRAAADAYRRDSIRFYERLPALPETARRKCALEAARSNLPNATETKIQVTWNARTVRHFLELRADDGADAEIRRLAFLVYDTMRTEAPNLFSDYEVNRVGGVDVLRTPYGKV